MQLWDSLKCIHLWAMSWTKIQVWTANCNLVSSRWGYCFCHKKVIIHINYFWAKTVLDGGYREVASSVAYRVGLYEVHLNIVPLGNKCTMPFSPLERLQRDSLLYSVILIFWSLNTQVYPLCIKPIPKSIKIGEMLLWTKLAL
jgi:hypothetical protein